MALFTQIRNSLSRNLRHMSANFVNRQNILTFFPFYVKLLYNYLYLIIEVFIMQGRLLLEKQEKDNLMPYACFSENAPRLEFLAKDAYRTEFQRDRDRIMHSKSFRRLEYKTQVFLPSINDHIRTRLTHSLEVSQLGRAVAIQLGLNTDLVEAIALGHDLGHTPFGHAGEQKLKKLSSSDSSKYSFKHNVQSVKILSLLEKQYNYDGLKITIPVLEGILKHTKLPDSLPDYCNNLYVDKSFSVTLEGQIIAIVDEIAQITHDMDDYFRQGIIQIEYFINSELFEMVDKFYYDCRKEHDIKAQMKKCEDVDRKKTIIIRCLIDFLITSLIENTREKLNSSIRAYDITKRYVYFNDPLKTVFDKFNKKLKEKIFSTSDIIIMDKKGQRIVTSLFDFYKSNPDALPESTLKLYNKNNERVLIDFISGMTDRFAIEQYRKIFEFN
jgi:dGTPase